MPKRGTAAGIVRAPRGSRRRLFAELLCTSSARRKARAAAAAAGARHRRGARGGRVPRAAGGAGRARARLVCVGASARCPYRTVPMVPKYGTISACVHAPRMPATWPSIRLCWLSAALLAFSAALLAFSPPPSADPPRPPSGQRRRVDADGRNERHRRLARHRRRGHRQADGRSDLAQADLCKPGWHFNLHSGDGTFRRARMTGKKRRCDSVIMHAAHGGMAASYDSPTIYAVKPGRVYTISYELRTDNLAPCCRGDTNRAGALTGGAYLRFFDMHGVKGSFSPALGTHAPQSTGGAWVRRSQRIETPTTARSARLHLAFAAHAHSAPQPDARWQRHWQRRLPHAICARRRRCDTAASAHDQRARPDNPESAGSRLCLPAQFSAVGRRVRSLCRLYPLAQPRT